MRVRESVCVRDEVARSVVSARITVRGCESVILLLLRELLE